MYRNKSELIELLIEETGKSSALLRQLTPLSLSARIAPEFMSLGELALHLTLAIPSITSALGFVYEDAPSKGAELGVDQLHEAYQSLASQCRQQVEQRLDDHTLFSETFKVYSFNWTAAYTFSVLIRHEIHHRGQMSVLMRQSGLGLPDIYGPAKKG